MALELVNSEGKEERIRAFCAHMVDRLPAPGVLSEEDCRAKQSNFSTKNTSLGTVLRYMYITALMIGSSYG